MKKSFSSAFSTSPRFQDIHIDALLMNATEASLVSYLDRCKNPPHDWADWLSFAVSRSYTILFQKLLDRGLVSAPVLVSYLQGASPTIRVLGNEYLYDHVLQGLLETDDVRGFKKLILTSYRFQEYQDSKNRRAIDLIRIHSAMKIWKFVVSEGYFSRLTREQMSPEMYSVWLEQMNVLYLDDIFEMIKKNDVSEIRSWIRSKRPINIRNQIGATPLHEAVRLGRDEIAEILRDAGAMLCSPADARQSTMSSMPKKIYFQRLSFLVREAFPLFLATDCEIVLFFHSVCESPRLFCCSVKYQRDPQDELTTDFVRRISNYVISRHDPASFFSPLCDEFRLFPATPVPLYGKGPKEFLGYFFSFRRERPSSDIIDDADDLPMITQALFLYRFEELYQYHRLWDRFLSRSPVFREWFDGMIEYCFSEESCIFYDALKRVMALPVHLIEGDGRYTELLGTHALCAIPFTRVSNEVYSMVSRYRDYGGVSFLLRKIRAHPFVYTLSDTIPCSLPPKALTRMDLFEILGRKSDVDIEAVNAIFLSDSPPLTRFSISLVERIRRTLDLEPAFRRNQVIGVTSSTNGHYRIFLPQGEVETAMNELTSTYNGNKLTDLTTMYKILVEWIHPFEDGNGRTFRLLFTLLLRSKGYYVILTKGDPLLRRIL